MEFQGWVALLVAVLLLGYAIPEVVSRRQTVADSRAEDRFSESMRIVARAGDSRAQAPRSSNDDHADRQPHESHPGITSASTPLLSRPREVAMKSTTGPARFPIAYRARVLAHARSQRAAAVSRRQAGGRRLAFLVVAILAVTVGAWVAVSRVGVPIATAIVPTVVAVGLLTIIVKGRINVVARNRTDREMIRRIDTELRALARGETVENPVSEEIIGGAARQAKDTADDADYGPQRSSGQAGKPARRTRDAADKAAATSGGGDRGPSGGGPGGGQRPDKTEAPAARRDQAYNLEAEFTDAEWASPDADPVTVPGEVVAEADEDAGDLPFDAERHWDDEEDQPQRSDSGEVAPEVPVRDDGRGWTPQRVPAPSWARQPDVPRRHTATYEAEDGPRGEVPSRPTVADARPGAPNGTEYEANIVEEPPEELEPTIDLQEVLARRRGA